MNLFTQTEGVIILVLFAAACILATSLSSRKGDTDTKVGYLVAHRDVGWVRAAFSIAATWIWAPALFVAAQQGYVNGWVGVFWFTVPNVLCLVLFAWFAARVRRQYPKGFTLSGIMRERYSGRVNAMYLVALTGLATCSFAVQLLAGGLVVSALTGLDFLFVTVALAATALAYTFRSGLGASIITDYLQMALIAAVGLVLAPWVVARAGVSTTLEGLAGNDGLHRSLVSGPGAAVFWAFGLSTTIGLMSGPFGDQSFWQRAFAIKHRDVKKAFIVGAGIFALVPLTMSLLGFAAAGAHLDIANVQLTNLAAVREWLPAWTVIPFLAFLLSGLTSTLDSNLAAVSSLAGHDLTRAPRHVIRNARTGMVLLAVAGILIANLPGLQVVQLFIFYGTLRASTLMPTILTLTNWRKPSEAGMFYGILLALIVGLPISAYGNLNAVTPAIWGGSLLVLIISGLVAAYMPSTRHEPSDALATETSHGD